MLSAIQYSNQKCNFWKSKLKCKEIKTKEQYTNEFHKTNLKIIKIKIKILEIEIKVFENPNLKFRFGTEWNEFNPFLHNVF